MNINELRQLAGLKEVSPVKASTTGNKEVNMGSGDWDKIANELGFKNKQEFIQAQLKSGTPDMKNALNNPNKYANQKIAFVSSDTASSTVDKPKPEELTKMHGNQKPVKPDGKYSIKITQNPRGRNDRFPNVTNVIDPSGKVVKSWQAKNGREVNQIRVAAQDYVNKMNAQEPASTIDVPDGTKIGKDIANQTISITKQNISKGDQGKHILELISAQAKSYNCDRKVILAKLQAAGGQLVGN